MGVAGGIVAVGTSVLVGAGVSVGLVVGVGTVVAGSNVAVAAGAAAGTEVAEAPQATANNTTITTSPPINRVLFLGSIRNLFIKSLALARSTPAEDESLTLARSNPTDDCWL